MNFRSWPTLEPQTLLLKVTYGDLVHIEYLYYGAIVVSYFP